MSGLRIVVVQAGRWPTLAVARIAARGLVSLTGQRVDLYSDQTPRGGYVTRLANRPIPTGDLRYQESVHVSLEA